MDLDKDPHMRVGVVGCGRHSTTSILPGLRQAGIEVAAVCSRHLDRATETAKRFGAPVAYDNATAMFESTKMEAVVIVVGARDYAPLVHLALEAGLPVLAEKPGFASSDEGFELAEASRIADLPVMVGYMKRFAPAYRQARSLIKTPTLGSFTFTVGPWGEGRSVRDYFLDNPVHLLDLARFLVGELSDVDASLTEVAGNWAIGAIARAESGAPVTFQFGTVGSWSQRNEFVEIYGSGDSVSVENIDTCRYRPNEGPEQVWRPNYTVPIDRNSTGVTMGFVPELEHFRSVVMEKVACESDVASAAATLRLAEGIASALSLM